MHESHLRQLFQKFHDAGFKSNSRKSVIGHSEVKFCGNFISADDTSHRRRNLRPAKTVPNQLQ